MLRVQSSEIAGRGVFTTQPLSVGDLIESCPVIVIPNEEVQFLDKTVIYNYYFDWKDGQAAIVLGFGSLYNHSQNNNATYYKRFDYDMIEFRCVKSIKAYEEITVFYQQGTWFFEA